MIKYAISTEGGHSGCPVVVDDKIIAIHNGGEKDKFNMGRLITPDLINNLRKWRE
jgi:V8-like Glu-specific endopeptidase